MSENVAYMPNRTKLTTSEMTHGSVASSYEMGFGLYQMAEPGTLNKLFGAGLIIKGVKDYMELPSPLPKEGSFRDRLRERIRILSESVIDKNGDSKKWSSRIKRGIAEETLSLQDVGYKNRVNRVIGSIAAFGMGLELTTLDTTAGKIAGAASMAYAVHENLTSTSEQVGIGRGLDDQRKLSSVGQDSPGTLQL